MVFEWLGGAHQTLSLGLPQGLTRWPLDLLACQLKMGTLFCFLRRIFYSAKLTQCGWMECFSLGQEWQKWALCNGNLAVRSSQVSSSIGFELRNWVMGLSAPQRRFTVEAAWRDELVWILNDELCNWQRELAHIFAKLKVVIIFRHCRFE